MADEYPGRRDPFVTRTTWDEYKQQMSHQMSALKADIDGVQDDVNSLLRNGQFVRKEAYNERQVALDRTLANINDFISKFTWVIIGAFITMLANAAVLAFVISGMNKR